MSLDQSIFFIYDGECPFCRHAAMALKIKRAYGQLFLLNAREESAHPVILQINKLGYDLDEGMVIYDGHTFFHGKDALLFMSRFGENKGFFNITNRLLHRFNIINEIVYPWMRGVRNGLLRKNGIEKIDNLALKAEPIFKSIFGNDWDGLPLIIKKHYANKPYTIDVTRVDGCLDVMCSGPIKAFAWLFWFMHGIPPFNETSVPVSISFESDQHTKFFYFNRTFNFKTRKAYCFRSRMIQIKNNEVIEVMPSRFGWRMNYVWEDQRVKLKHKGYVFYAFGHFIPIPLTFLMGEGNAEEIAIDDDHFEMTMTITHPWWGKIYEYKGRFTLEGYQ